MTREGKKKLLWAEQFVASSPRIEERTDKGTRISLMGSGVYIAVII